MADPGSGKRPLPSQSRRLPPPEHSRSSPTVTHPDGARHWVTLRQAAEATGIPASTIRNWARKERITNQLDLRQEGPRRMVDLADVTDRAQKLGRIDAPPPPPDGPRPRREPAPAAAQPRAPEDAMLVPIDAWNRMLTQLGNLHEAGQQLAEARERAGKAETEATFLRERLAELREELAEAKETTSFPAPDPAPDRTPRVPWWVAIYRRWGPR